jgi:hypothetical protein
MLNVNAMNGTSVLVNALTAVAQVKLNLTENLTS